MCHLHAPIISFTTWNCFAFLPLAIKISLEIINNTRLHENKSLKIIGTQEILRSTRHSLLFVASCEMTTFVIMIVSSFLCCIVKINKQSLFSFLEYSYNMKRAWCLRERYKKKNIIQFERQRASKQEEEQQSSKSRAKRRRRVDFFRFRFFFVSENKR